MNPAPVPPATAARHRSWTDGLRGSDGSGKTFGQAQILTRIDKSFDRRQPCKCRSYRGRSGLRALAVVVALATAPIAPARAGEFSDLVMAPGLLAPATEGEIFRYRISMAPRPAASAGPGVQNPVPSPDGSELILLGEGQSLHLVIQVDGDLRQLAVLSENSANPVLLYFLESLVRHLSEATGGSPYYLKNRLTEALNAAAVPPSADVKAEPVTLELLPFAEDRNAARLGPFAQLRLRISFNPARPERLLSLIADTDLTSAGFRLSLELIGEAP